MTPILLEFHATSCRVASKKAAGLPLCCSWRAMAELHHRVINEQLWTWMRASFLFFFYSLAKRLTSICRDAAAHHPLQLEHGCNLVVCLRSQRVARLTTMWQQAPALASSTPTPLSASWLTSTNSSSKTRISASTPP